MANTKIQIKRSSITAAPTTLDIGELAYSYTSNTLYIGNTSGSGVLAIGGLSVGVSVNAYANLVGLSANNYAGFMANSANAYASSIVDANLIVARAYTNVSATSANNFAGFMANSANQFALSTFVKLTSGTTQTITSDITLSGNLTVAGTQTFANTQTLLIGDNIITLNADIPGTVAPAENAGIEVNRGNKNSNAAITFIESVGAWAFSSNTLNSYTTYIASNTIVESVALSANNYAGFMANAANAYASSIVDANLIVARAYTNVSTASANNFAGAMVNIANTNAANGSYISTGVVKVPYGGTGLVTFTQNGIVFGNTAGDLKVTAAGTEGQVLQASSTGLPSFGMLDGGSF